MISSFYVGQLAHTRLSPRRHSFRYRVFMPFVDIEEIEPLVQQLPFWSSNRLGIARFLRSDFLGAPEQPLLDAVKQRIQEETGSTFNGRVFLLANWRYFGLQNNPIACYFCYDQERLEYIIAEVTNTPWGERHSYVLTVDTDGSVFSTMFQKELHVSPFNGMQQVYRWFSNAPGNTLGIKISNLEDGKPMFHACLTLKSVPLTASNGLKLIASYPLETLKVTAAIYWQAFILLLKGLTLQPHPKNNQSV